MFSFLATLNIRLISIVLAVLLTFSAGWTTNGWRLNKRYESEKLAQAQANRKTEIEHQKAVDLIRTQKNAQIENINNQLFTFVSELHKRTARPNNLSNNGQITQFATGQQLYAEDAEFLIREAARADTIRIALQSCYAQYDQITKE